MATTGDGRLDRLDSRDRAYAESIEDAAERDAVVTTILRYQRPDRLGVGDPVPRVELPRLDDGRLVRLESLVEERPLVLVFGSFT